MNGEGVPALTKVFGEAFTPPLLFLYDPSFIITYNQVPSAQMRLQYYC
jgi:hypothetical protein